MVNTTSDKSITDQIYISFNFLYFLTALFKLLLSMGFSFVISFERELHTHPGGVCTHTLVGFGSCLYTMISVHLNDKYNSDSADPARICAQIVSGMGFLGSATIFKSGSTQFGDTIDDLHNLTGSLSLSGSFITNGVEVSEISNDTALTDGSSQALITENALKTYLTTETEDFQNYLRKSFVHTGSFVSSATQSFTAVTASAPSGIATTTIEDFMFFNNGTFMETDALTIQQSGSKMFLFINTDSIGYDLDNNDEIVAFGKFNS